VEMALAIRTLDADAGSAPTSSPPREGDDGADGLEV
jgi:hypothetical protein